MITTTAPQDFLTCRSKDVREKFTNSFVHLFSRFGPLCDGALRAVRVTPSDGEIILRILVSSTDFEHFEKPSDGQCKSPAELNCELSSERIRD